MTLPSSDRIRNSNLGGLMPSTLPLGHEGSLQYWVFTSERRKSILFLWNLNARAGFEPVISDFVSRQLQPLLLFMALCTTENHWSNSMRVRHSPDFGLLSVAILPWLCRRRRKTVFIGLVVRFMFPSLSAVGRRQR